MTYQIKQVVREDQKKEIARKLLESLRDWFGIKESREEYIADSAAQVFFAANDNGENIGFLCLKETGKSTVEIAVMGVLQKYHRQGVGEQLFRSAVAYARSNNYEFIQVKTVATGYYNNYDNTNRFYQHIGFKEFEVFPTLWGETNPCQIYVMAI